MTSRYQNPYHVADPDDNEIFFGRQWILEKLDEYLHPAQVVEPSCVSVIAERGIGGKAAVQQFIHTRAKQLNFRIVQCDLKSDLGRGETAADFYRALVSFVWRKLDALPPQAYQIADRLAKSQSKDLYTIEADFSTFFELVREHNPTHPLLLIFYSFDRLPGHFHFDGLDWTLLRELHNNRHTCLYYLVVSRRPLSHIENLHGLERSLFSTIFPTTLRLGLLNKEEARALINEPAQEALAKDSPWPDWLEQQILYWGGRNPYCLELICFHLFGEIWNQKKRYQPEDAPQIALQIIHERLARYFNRLYENLNADGLNQALVYAVESGHSAVRHDQIQKLVDLGYFLPELARDQEYVLFSPLFHQYLVERGVLKSGYQLSPLTPSTSATTTQNPEANQSLPEPLTPRELDVLPLLAAGQSNKEIAEKLVIAENTVKEHVRNIFEKLGVHNRTQVLTKSQELGLL